MEQNSFWVSLIAVLMGTFEHSHSDGRQLPVTGDTVSTTSCTTSCVKGLHQHQPGTNTQGLSTAAAALVPKDGHEKPKADKAQEETVSCSGEKLSKLLRCGAPTTRSWHIPLRMETDVSQRFCSIPSAPWPPGRASPSVQTSAQAWPVGDNSTTDIPGLHPPCRPILQVSIASIVHYPWDPLCQCAYGEMGAVAWRTHAWQTTMSIGRGLVRM